mmetsp:Transcript_46687/g.99582  ORF Transcript_46687/g.99582 Transcript_46687/m.99582 type:complete len:155 (-) Transcript_46687:89-553(-)
MVRAADSAMHVLLAKAAVFAALWFAGVSVSFGTPVFIVLVIVAMFTCGTSQKWRGDASAYSVFNDGVRIAGTMSADQIDAQMRNGGHAPRVNRPAESAFVQAAVRGWGGGAATAPQKARVRAASAAENSEEDIRRRRAAAGAAAEARTGGRMHA